MGWLRGSSYLIARIYLIHTHTHSYTRPTDRSKALHLMCCTLSLFSAAADCAILMLAPEQRGKASAFACASDSDTRVGECLPSQRRRCSLPHRERKATSTNHVSCLGNSAFVLQQQKLSEVNKICSNNIESRQSTATFCMDVISRKR